MARFKVNDYVDIGCKGYPTGVSWEVALDENFEHIIDSVYDNEEALVEWISPLPKIDGNGYYADLDEVHARCKMHILDDVSKWFVVDVRNQNDQKVRYVDSDGILIKEVNSLDIGFN